MLSIECGLAEEGCMQRESSEEGKINGVRVSAEQGVVSLAAAGRMVLDNWGKLGQVHLIASVHAGGWPIT